MRIIKAENSGFCFGVKRAIELTEAEISERDAGRLKGRLYTCGPLIHNDTVNEWLKAKGVESINDRIIPSKVES